MFSPAWLALLTAFRYIRIKVPKYELHEQKEKENRKTRRARKDGAKAKAEGRARAKVPQTLTPLWIRKIHEVYLLLRVPVVWSSDYPHVVVILTMV